MTEIRSNIGPARPAPTSQPAPAMTTLSDGLKYADRVVGTGPCPKPGDTVVVDYVGRLTSGQEFDSSFKRGQPYSFVIGTGAVIAGWDEGVMSMQKGGQRSLEIPPDLAYGGRPKGPIPPNSTLLFEVTLHEIQPAS